jgi:hypothetical protein
MSTSQATTNAASTAASTSNTTITTSTTAHNKKKKKSGSNKSTTTTSAVTSFKGSTKEMNGHVYQCYGEAKERNQFSRTTEELIAYVGKYFTEHAGDIIQMIEKLEDLVLEPPAAPEGGETAAFEQKELWKLELKDFNEQRKKYKANKLELYAVIWGQCSESMQSRVKAAVEFETFRLSRDSLLLLKEIKGIAYRFESQEYIFKALHDAKAAYYNSKQGIEETCDTYRSRFINAADVIEHYGGDIGSDPILIKAQLKKMDYAETTTDSPF